MSIRLLLNENFPAPSIALLRSRSFDLLAIGEMASGRADTEVMALAVREQRWLVTFDRDYGELLFARKLAAPPAVILLRAPSYRPQEPAQWIIELSRDPEQRLGRFTVFDGKTIRTRPLLYRIADDST